MKTLALAIIAFILSATFVVGAEVGSLNDVDASNGIDQTEALSIAEAFFFIHISGCGYPAEPSSEGDNWVSKTHIGIAGKPGPPIYINKASGKVTWENIESTVEELRKAKSNQSLKGRSNTGRARKGLYTIVLSSTAP